MQLFGHGGVYKGASPWASIVGGVPCTILDVMDCSRPSLRREGPITPPFPPNPVGQSVGTWGLGPGAWGVWEPNPRNYRKGSSMSFIFFSLEFPRHPKLDLHHHRANPIPSPTLRRSDGSVREPRPAGISITTINIGLSLNSPPRLDFVSTQESDPPDATPQTTLAVFRHLRLSTMCLGLEALVGLYAVPNVPEAQILLFPKSTDPTWNSLRRPRSPQLQPFPANPSNRFKPQSNSPSSSHPRVP